MSKPDVRITVKGRLQDPATYRKVAHFVDRLPAEQVAAALASADAENGNAGKGGAS